MATANPTALFTTLPRTEFIQKNLGLVHSCAGRFTGRGIEYEELYSAGCLGLVKACDGFDPDRGVCFSTYAVPVILGEIKKLFRDGGTVKVSRSIKELGLKVTAERERLMKLTGAEPTVAQLAQNLGATPEQVAVSIQAAMPVVSLTPADDEDGTREWDIPVDSPEEVLAERISLAQIQLHAASGIAQFILQALQFQQGIPLSFALALAAGGGQRGAKGAVQA